MPINNYYDTLGVPRQANQDEIRKAYRKLAVKYHPDQNAAHDAHQQFTRINEAYQVLKDPLKRRLYDARFRALERYSRPHYYDANAAQPYYTHTYRPPAHPHPLKENELDPYVPYVRAASAIAIALSMLLLLDYVLASYSAERLVKRIEYRFTWVGNYSAFVFDGKDELLVDIEKSKNLYAGDAFRLRTTPLFGIHTRVKVTQRGKFSPKEGLKQQFYPHYGIYNVFLFFGLGLVISGLCGLLIHKEKSGILFNFGLLSLLLTFITIFITLNS